MVQVGAGRDGVIHTKKYKYIKNPLGGSKFQPRIRVLDNGRKLEATAVAKHIRANERNGPLRLCFARRTHIRSDQIITYHTMYNSS